jgi:amino-acid N-acetyltransferase
MSTELTLRPVETEPDRARLLALLDAQQLPVEDIGAHTRLYGLWQGDVLIGSGALEYYGDAALLRSVAVAEAGQGQGYGAFITGALERLARAEGAASLILLTTTAEGFFAKRGYKTIDRSEAPAAVRQSSEFAAVCPSTATVMRKVLGEER